MLVGSPSTAQIQATFVTPGSISRNVEGPMYAPDIVVFDFPEIRQPGRTHKDEAGIAAIRMGRACITWVSFSPRECAV